jgi:hypothetical protein
MANLLNNLGSLAASGAAATVAQAKRLGQKAWSTADRIRLERALAMQVAQPMRAYKLVRKNLLAELRNAYATDAMDEATFIRLVAAAEVQLVDQVNTALQELPGRIRTTEKTADIAFDLSVLKGVTLNQIDQVRFVEVAESEADNVIQDGVKAVGPALIATTTIQAAKKLATSRRAKQAVTVAKTAKKGGGLASLAVGYAAERAITAGVKKADAYLALNRRVNQLFAKSNLQGVFDEVQADLDGQLSAFRATFRSGDIVLRLPDMANDESRD